MSEPTLADTIYEIMQRPYYGGQPFSARELVAIIRAEGNFTQPPTVASVLLRINHLHTVGKIFPVDAEHVAARSGHEINRIGNGWFERVPTMADRQ